MYDSWEQFSDDFIRSFRSTCWRPVTIGELRACRQRHGEKLHGYIQRWTALKNNAENISDEIAVDSFTNGLLRKDLVEYIGRVRVAILSHLMEVANSWADGQELAHNGSPRASGEEDRYDGNRRYSNDAYRKKKRKGRGYDKMESTEMVAAEFPASRSNDYRKQGHEQPREQARDPGREKG
jgi:hypothetical protein